MASLRKKYEEIEQLRHHFWDDAEITERVAKSRKYAYLLAPRAVARAAANENTESAKAAQRTAELNNKIRLEESQRVSKALTEARREEKAKRKEIGRAHV